MRKLSIEIPGRFVPCVRMTQRSKWTPRAKKYLAWKKATAWELAKACCMESLDTPCRVRIVIKANRENFDGDNVEKGILDSLKYANLIPNDTVEYVREVRWNFVPRKTESLQIFVETV